MAESRQLVRFDWAIKYLLRDKANFDVLEGFLSALLEDDDLKIIGLVGEESNQKDEDEKFNRVDLMVEDANKQRIIIEVQTTRESDYLERLLFGTSKVVIENTPLGEPYKNVKKVISVSILFFNLGRGTDYLYHGKTTFKGMNDGSELVVRKKEEIVLDSDKKYQLKEQNIFPEYYLIRVEKYKNVVKKRIDEWVYLIKNNAVLEGSKSKGIEAARHKLDYLNMSKAERERYERFMMNLAREKDMIKTAKDEGLAEGEKKGLVKGEAKGRKAERLEMNDKIVTNCVKSNMTNEQIAIIIGLTIGEIKSIRARLGI